jgi:hypothetical protein
VIYDCEVEFVDFELVIGIDIVLADVLDFLYCLRMSKSLLGRIL